MRSCLHNGLLLAAPVALSVQCTSHDRDGPTEVTVEIEPGPFATELNACLADQAACVALCDRVLVEQGYTDYPDAVSINECSVAKKATHASVIG
jgi:hypothetical protein